MIESTRLLAFSKPKHVTSQIIRPQSRQSIHRSNNFDRPSFENLVLSSSNSSIAAHNAAAAVANASNTANPSGQVDLLPQLQPGYPLSRQRHHLIRTARGRTGIIFGSRPLIPASSVPEELIEQVQVVLQGKSRNLILRELQRTVRTPPSAFALHTIVFVSLEPRCKHGCK